MSNKIKQYNQYPARYTLRIPYNSKCSLEKDKQLCIDKGFDTLGFILWYDENLLQETISLQLTPFNYILSCITNGIIQCTYVKNNYRLACLILSMYAKASKPTIWALREAYLKDHPDFYEHKSYEKIDFESLYKYDRFTANKIMFPYFASLGIDKELIAELISRRLIAYDGKYKYKNIVYVCQDLYDQYGMETLGMTAIHYQQLKGKPFPFIYFREELEAFKMTDFEKAEFFGNTLDMLKYLSDLKASDSGIPCRTAYVSLHSANYNVCAYANFKEKFPNVKEVWHCIKKELTEEIPSIQEESVQLPEVDAANEEKVAMPTIVIDEPAAELYYTKEQLIQMRDNGQLTSDIFLSGFDSKEINVPFEEVICLPQDKEHGGEIYFIHDEYGDIDIWGRPLLPF